MEVDNLEYKSEEVTWPLDSYIVFSFWSFAASTWCFLLDSPKK